MHLRNSAQAPLSPPTAPFCATLGACGRVDRALDSRSEGLGFDSQCWPCVEVSGKLRIPHCFSPPSRNGYLVHRSKVGSMAAGCTGAHLARGKVKFVEHALSWSLNSKQLPLPLPLLYTVPEVRHTLLLSLFNAYLHFASHKHCNSSTVHEIFVQAPSPASHINFAHIPLVTPVGGSKFVQSAMLELDSHSHFPEDPCRLMYDSPFTKLQRRKGENTGTFC